MTSQSEAFEDFYDAAYRRIVRSLVLVVGSREPAEDVVQEAFARLVPRWDEVSGHGEPEAWVRRVALNLVVDGSRHARVRTRFLERHRRVEPAHEDVYPSHDGFAAALHGLPVEQRKVLVLRYVVGLPLEDLAAELGITVAAAKSRLHRARTSLTPTMTEDARHA